ncbi:transcriptional regulator with XRE-family HTH domain [Litorivivens lipolytica]|uniref:Transcriptional regulator with XRE-family HTH domain n=1 Tax=Litorivivens lipolytica TaxID=1524264 RepID=A0A7W4Z642_9GAMM|nr:helix-turn-helix domain-containing protein [Litorivivens lipolytica]MBB3047853.1 transcriptional regulator with XRE-family HTH domain [Litorivivens lipolytica]
MSQNQHSKSETASAFSRFLRFWRSVHKVSQEELAFRLGSSPRHISRLENGSSRPSESMVTEVAEALSLGKRDRNHLLMAGGFAPVAEGLDFNAPELKWLRKAMIMTMRGLDPYPASVMDSAANLLMVNRGWVSFYSRVVPAEELSNVRNHYDFIFDRHGAGNIVSDWEDTLSAILMSIQQAYLFTSDEKVRETLDRLTAFPSVPEDWQQRAARTEPMASFRVQLNVAGALRRFFSVSTMAGALGPNAFVSEPRLTITTLYPEEEGLDLAAMQDENASHPLLFY